MATTTGTDRLSAAGRFEGLEPEQLIRAFRIMHMARRLDDRTGRPREQLFLSDGGFLIYCTIRRMFRAAGTYHTPGEIAQKRRGPGRCTAKAGVSEQGIGG